MNQFNFRNLFTFTVLFASMSVHSHLTQAEEITTEKSTSKATELKIEPLITEATKKLSELKETKKTLELELADRKSVPNPDSNFQLATIQLERKLSETDKEIKNTEDTVTRLSTSLMSLEVCKKDSAGAVKSAAELSKKISARLKAINADLLEEKIKATQNQLQKLRQEKNTDRERLAVAQAELDKILNSPFFSELTKKVFGSLESLREISFSPSVKESEKQKLLLSLLSQPKLLDDISEASKNGGRATDNLIGRHQFNGEFLTKVAPNGSFPRVGVEKIGTQYLQKLSAESSAYLKEKTSFSGISAIALKKPFSETLSLAREGLISQQAKQAPKQQFKSEAERLTFDALIRNNLETEQDAKIQQAKTLSTQISELKLVADYIDQVIAKRIQDTGEELRRLESAAYEARSLKKFQEQLAQNSKQCGAAEKLAEEILAQIDSGKLPATDGSIELIKTTSSGHTAIKEIDRISRQPQVKELMKEE